MLSAGGNIDTSFGDGGYITGVRAQALFGGEIIGQASGNFGPFTAGEEVLSSPDGKTVVPYNGAIPQPPPQNVQSDGKYLILSNGVLTRYNPNHTVDTTFGNNGSVTDFGDGNPDDLFNPVQVLVNGNKIYLAGIYNNSTFGYPGNFAALEGLNPDGSVNHSFGTNGIGVDFQLYGQFPSYFYFLRMGPDGEFYEGWDNDDQSWLIRFSADGNLDGGANAAFDPAVSPSILGMQFEPDGKIVLLTVPRGWIPELLRLNHDLTPDTSFGPDGLVPLPPKFGFQSFDGAVTESTLLLRADGEIIVGITGFDQNVPDFTLAFRPDAVPNSGSVSGRFFNDLNGNHKQDQNEPGLAYWQAYADLNNNGVYDVGEPSGFADVRGTYTIKNLVPGSYVIREVRQEGWTRTLPAGTWPTHGFYKVKVSANKNVTGLNFGNTDGKKAKGSISGTIFNDVNGDRIQDNGETGLAGWQAYVDVNNNGIHDAGEPIAAADKDGHYKITGLFEGGYVVREIRKNGWSRTTPPGAWPAGFIEVNLAAGKDSTGNDFGECSREVGYRESLRSRLQRHQ